MNLRAAVWVAFLAGAAPAGHGETLPSPDGELRQLAAAFQAGDADRLAALAPPGGRVLLDLSAPRRLRGAFGRGQLAAVWAQLFEQVSTAAFALDPAARRFDEATAFASARWHWRGRDREAAVTLVVALEWRSSAWRLVELRSAP